MSDLLADRRRARERMIALAARYVHALRNRVGVVAAAVAGSVARGDFNVWSDIDVLVVAEGLPARLPDRGALLASVAPPGVQAVGFSPAEFREAWRRGNRLVREAVEGGVVLEGAEFLLTIGEQGKEPLRTDRDGCTPPRAES
jgi:uncharacterized protein